MNCKKISTRRTKVSRLFPEPIVIETTPRRDYNYNNRQGGKPSTLAYNQEGLLAIGHKTITAQYLEDRTPREFGQVSIWNEQGTYISTIPASSGVNSLSWSPTGAYLAAGITNGYLNIYRKQNQHYLPVLMEPNTKLNVATSLSYSPNPSGYLAAGSGNMIRILDQNLKLIRTLSTGLEEIRYVSFSPYDGFLAVAAGDVIMIWDPTLERLERRITLSNSANALAYSWSDPSLAVGSNDQLLIWDNPHQTRPEVKIIGSPISALAYSPYDGSLAVGAQDLIMIWGPYGDLTQTLPSESHVRAMAYSPTNGDLAVIDGTRDESGPVKIWKNEPQQEHISPIKKPSTSHLYSH